MRTDSSARRWPAGGNASDDNGPARTGFLNVAIEATAIGSARGGDETYARELLHGLALAADPGDRFVVYLRPGVAEPDPIRENRAFTIRRVAGGGLLRYGVRLPLAARSDAVDLLHCAVHSPPLSPVPVAFMLPDLSFVHHPEFYRPATRLRLKLLIPWHLRQARVVMTVSEFSREDIIRTYGLPEEKVLVVPNAVHIPEPRVDDPARRQAWLAGHGIGAPFFLYLGNLQPRKNLRRLIVAFVRARSTPALSKHLLVLAGEHWAWGGSRESLAGLAPEGSVISVGRVTDDERGLLLRETVGFAYPSIFEGFGLPPLEALAAGAPVISSRTSAMPEVLGDAAVLIDPLDVDAITGALVRIGTDSELCRVLRRRGLERAARFDVRTMGERALAAFSYALSHAGAQPRRGEPRRSN